MARDNIFEFFVSINPVYLVLLAFIVFFGGVAVLAMSWAVRDGQFQNFERTAQSIFDPDEPVGQMTDRFPEDR